MTTYKVIHAGKRDGYEISFEFSNEECTLDELLDSEHINIDEVAREIEQGYLSLFRVTCVAKINDVRLGRADLGGCFYDSEEDFLSDDYASDLEAEAIANAQEALNNLVVRVA